MNTSNHLKALSFGTVAWVVFLILGLPDYYQQYSTGFMIIFSLAILLPLWIISVLVIHWLEGESAYRRSILVSFYATASLFVYDAFFCGIYLGSGWDFLTRYWYLSVYYIIPWLVLPSTGSWLDRQGQPNLGKTTLWAGMRTNWIGLLASAALILLVGAR